MHSFIHSFIHLFIQLFFRSPIHAFTCSFTYSLTNSFTLPLTLLLTFSTNQESPSRFVSSFSFSPCCIGCYLFYSVAAEQGDLEGYSSPQNPERGGQSTPSNCVSFLKLCKYGRKLTRCSRFLNIVNPDFFLRNYIEAASTD